MAEVSRKIISRTRHSGRRRGSPRREPDGPASSGRREPTTVERYGSASCARPRVRVLSQQSRAPARTRSVPAGTRAAAASGTCLPRTARACASCSHDIMMAPNAATRERRAGSEGRSSEVACIVLAVGFAIWLTGWHVRQNSGHCRDPHLGLSPDNLGRPKRTRKLARKRNRRKPFLTHAQGCRSGTGLTMAVVAPRGCVRGRSRRHVWALDQHRNRRLLSVVVVLHLVSDL